MPSLVLPARILVGINECGTLSHRKLVMNRQEFALAFYEAMERACQAAETSLGGPLSRDVIVRMYGANSDGIEVSPQEFIERTYISGTRFYRLIDVMVTEVVGSRPVLFARISSHLLGPLSATWNGENGPFKLLTPEAIVQRQ